MLSIFFLIYMNLIRILEWDLETANSKIKKLLIAHLKDIKKLYDKLHKEYPQWMRYPW
jgi:hypothetical protein